MIALLGWFMLGNAMGTVTGARSYLDPLAALICVVAIELAIRGRRPLRQSRPDALAVQLLDMSRLGFSYGLLLEGFKLL